MEEVFSEYEIKEGSILFDGETSSTTVGCVGSLEETLNSKTITKKCEGVEETVAVKGDGTGELKLTLHIKKNLFDKAYGMDIDGLIDGVRAYGQNSVHKNFSFVGKVYDENGTLKLKAYPKLIITSGISRSIENGAEEVAEIEISASINPDDYGNGMYEVLYDDLSSDEAETIMETWMNSFDPVNLQLVES